VRHRQLSASGQIAWRSVRLAMLCTAISLALTAILPGVWRNLLGGAAALCAATWVLKLHWTSVGGRRFWRWSLLISIGMMVVPWSPLIITGRSMLSILLLVLLVLRPYHFLRDLGSGRRALTWLGAMSLVVAFLVLRGPAEATNPLAQVLHHIHGSARFVLVTFWVMCGVWIFLGVRLHFMRMRPKLAVAGLLIAAVPIGLILTLGVLGAWSLLGAGRAEQATAVLADQLDLVASGNLRGPGPFGEGFGEALLAPGEDPADRPWMSDLADAVASAPFDPMPPAIWLDLGGELWAVALTAEDGRPVLVGGRHFGRKQLARLAESTGCLVGMYNESESGWSFGHQDLGDDSGLIGGELFEDSSDSGVVMLAWPKHVRDAVALDTDDDLFILSRMLPFGAAPVEVWRLGDRGLARDEYYVGLHTRPGDALAYFTGRENDLNMVVVIALATIAVIFIFMEAFAFYFGLRIVGGVTGAVGHLHKATEQMASGNLDTSIDVPNEDEFGDLADSFNEMTRAIRIAQEQIVQKELLEAQLETARLIQQRLLPAQMPNLDGFQIAGTSDPSLQVGGDYFDFVEMPDGRLGIAVADVTGKGVPAALLMANVQAGLHGQALHPGTAAEIMGRMNDLLYASTDAHMFVTFALIVLDPTTGEVESVSAGHEPTLLIRPDGSYEKLEAGGLMLGMLPGFEYSEVSAQMDPGDVLVLYTDGVTEAMGPEPVAQLVEDTSATEPVEDEDEDDDELILPFFEDHRLIDLCVARRHDTAEEIRQALLSAVRNFAQDVPQSDDITIVVVKRENAA